MSEDSKKTMLWGFFLGIVCILVFFPLLQPGFIKTDDGGWMIIRLSAFYQSWREGQFPVRFLGRLNHSYGYPVANFLYPGFLYLGSLIHVFGISFINTIKLLFIGSVVLGTVSTFYWLKRHVSHTASVIGALHFLFTPYLLFDVFSRGSVGEVLAMGVAAFILYCVEYERKVLFTLAFALLLLSHNSLALLFLIFFICLLVWQRKISFLPLITIAVGMTAFFWVPALLEKQYVLFDLISVSNPFEYFISVRWWYLIGIGSLVVCILHFFQKRTDPKMLWFSVVFLVSVFLAVPASGFFWKTEMIAKLFQFPYRMLSLSLLPGSYIIAHVISIQEGVKQRLIIFFLVLLWLAPWLQMVSKIEHTTEPESYYVTNEATTTVANEYMPLWVRQIPSNHPPSKVEFVKGQGVVDNPQITTQQIRAVIRALDDSIIQINTIYYPGWGATLGMDRVQLLYDNPNGVMQIRVPKGTYELQVAFRETLPRFAATSISGMVFLGFLLWSWIPKPLIATMWYGLTTLMREKPVGKKRRQT